MNKNDAANIAFNKLMALGMRRCPNLRVGYKDQSWLIWVLSVLVGPFNDKFSLEGAVTIGSTIYFPSRKWQTDNPVDAWATLAHEYVHVFDGQRLGIGFKLRYLFPQIIAAFSLFAVLAPIVHPLVYVLACLVCLAPWPAPFRVDLEARAYGASILAFHGVGLQESGSAYASWLCGNIYYWASWSSSGSQSKVDHWALRANNPSAEPEDAPYEDIHIAIDSIPK